VKAQLSHLIHIEDLTQNTILQLIQQAELHQQQTQDVAIVPPARQHITLANLFFEPSTRTRCSFELAARRLGLNVLNLHLATSSLQKGESLVDTINTLEAMGCQLLVVRHPDNGVMRHIATHLQSTTAMINAGEGSMAHPTQALTDMLTIYQRHKGFANLRVCLIGDIAHSRVARSEIAALHLLGVPDIRVVAPERLLPKDVAALPVTHCKTLEQGLRDCDVIITLRIQKERMQHDVLPDAEDYYAQYGLSAKRLQLANPGAIVMHPGPMNRGIEIDSEVADGAQSVILQQVRNGVAMRMAVIERLLF
jgi:aspartate carbamoyltransferase catalytic subunit